MSSSVALMHKHYADKGVQTDPYGDKFPLTSTTTGQRDSTGFFCAVSPELHDAAEDHFHQSTQAGSAYSHSATRTDTPSPEPSILTTTRTYTAVMTLGKPADVKPNITSRIVSLPETVSEYSARMAAQKTTARVVSMPLPSTSSGRLDKEGELSDDDMRALLSDDEEPSRVRVRSRVSEMPHTPSLPSSPDSVVIIGNKNQLADGFLRGSQVEDSPPRKPDPDGWISWAKSPPRPIPALHGPLSLPYARCPSGAEGTIIEEPEDLPRMIWGLEGEDLQPPRLRSSLLSSPQRLATQTVKNNMPPRFQRARSEASVNHHSQLSGLDAQDTNRIRLPTSALASHSSQQRDELVGYPLRGQEPIDLAELLRRELVTNGADGLSNVHLVALDHTDNGIHAYTRLHKRGQDWSSTMLDSNAVQDNSRFPSSASVSNRTPASCARTLPSGSLDRLNGQYALPKTWDQCGERAHTTDGSISRRQTALEIAQRYRQKQELLQHQQEQQMRQQSFLPTPPNSSSPIWSSSFSPFPQSALSPKLLSGVSGKPKLSPSIALSRSAPYLSGIPEQVQQASLVTGLACPPLNNSLLVPDVQAQQDLYVITPAAYSLTRSIEEHARGLGQQLDDVLNQSLSSTSPALPRPPPNTPLTTSTTHAKMGKRKPSVALPVSAALPPSPATSPQHSRVRTLTSQQTRSIPLTRLIQRRLSAVPEEDHADQEQPPSPPTMLPRSRTHSVDPVAQTAETSQLNHLLSPPLFPTQKLSVASPFHNTLLAQTTLVGDDGASLILGAGKHTAQVKLPDSRGGQAAGRRHSAKEGSARGLETIKNKGPKRGTGRGRGRGGTEGNRVTNGPERVDGGLMVKS